VPDSGVPIGEGFALVGAGFAFAVSFSVSEAARPVSTALYFTNDDAVVTTIELADGAQNFVLPLRRAEQLVSPSVRTPMSQATLAQGAYLLSVCAGDEAGNAVACSAPHAILVRTHCSVPDAELLLAPTRIRVAPTGAYAIVAITLVLRRAARVAGANLTLALSPAGETRELNSTALALPDGAYEAAVTATDGHGLVSDPVVFTIVFDTHTETPVLLSPLSGTLVGEGYVLPLVFSLGEDTSTLSVLLEPSGAPSGAPLRIELAEGVRALSLPLRRTDQLTDPAIRTPMAPPEVPPGLYALRVCARDVRNNSEACSAPALALQIHTHAIAPLVVALGDAVVSSHPGSRGGVRITLAEPASSVSIALAHPGAEDTPVAVVVLAPPGATLELNFSVDATRRLDTHAFYASSTIAILPEGAYVTRVSVVSAYGLAAPGVSAPGDPILEVDTHSEAPVVTAPLPGAETGDGGSMALAFSLTEPLWPNSVQLTLSGASGAPIAIGLADGATALALPLTRAAQLQPANAVAIRVPMSTAAVPPGRYNLTICAQDARQNPAACTLVAGIRVVAQPTPPTVELIGAGVLLDGVHTFGGPANPARLRVVIYDPETSAVVLRFVSTEGGAEGASGGSGGSGGGAFGASVRLGVVGVTEFEFDAGGNFSAHPLFITASTPPGGLADGTYDISVASASAPASNASAVAPVRLRLDSRTEAPLVLSPLENSTLATLTPTTLQWRLSALDHAPGALRGANANATVRFHRRNTSVAVDVVVALAHRDTPAACLWFLGGPHAPPAACVAPGVNATAARLPDGTYDVSLTSTDELGNAPATTTVRNVVVQYTTPPPRIALTPGANGTVRIQVAFAGPAEDAYATFTNNATGCALVVPLAESGGGAGGALLIEETVTLPPDGGFYSMSVAYRGRGTGNPLGVAITPSQAVAPAAPLAAPTNNTCTTRPTPTIAECFTSGSPAAIVAWTAGGTAAATALAIGVITTRARDAARYAAIAAQAHG
jgi:hypothetical protein